MSATVTRVRMDVVVEVVVVVDVVLRFEAEAMDANIHDKSNQKSNDTIRAEGG
jgi:hypothetical protein